MEFTDHGRDYRTVRASDLRRDGMALELIAMREDKTVATVYYSDATGEFTVSVFEQELPLTVIERLTQAARIALPPEMKVHGI